MTTAAEQLNRRLGRMEALAGDLAGLQPGYQPTELELYRARELAAAIVQTFFPAAPAEAAPEPAPAAPEKKPKK